MCGKYKQHKKSMGGGNKIIYSLDNIERRLDKRTIVESWKYAYNEDVSRKTGKSGLRAPQFGALSAIRAHWITSDAPATVIMPTGTGKTETMFATIASERITTTLIIVPSNLLRKQLFEGASHFGILPELGVISSEAILPNTLLYKSTVKSEKQEHFLKELDNVNVIVSTPTMIKKMPRDVLQKLTDNVELVVFDEAHHLAAPVWKAVREHFFEKKILQFTATPYRNDGKKVDGKIIFNYGLGLAQQNGYFKSIDFNPIQEFEERKSDEKIAQKSVNLLNKDLKDDLDHILLARAKNQKRANYLYKEVYSKYTNLNPVIIHSGLKKSDNDSSLNKLKNGESRIVVCVNMFGEGIDIPTLKIAAIHDKYKSLPITLQFIGRFARTSDKKLGNAKLVTNVAIDDLKEGIEDLYHQDSDWNRLLNVKSNNTIEKEFRLEDFNNEFKKGRAGNLDLSQLKMKISTRMFRYDSENIDIQKWKDVFDAERTTHLPNYEESVYIFIEELETAVPWTDQQDVLEFGYNFFVIFYDKKNSIVHINETDVGKGTQLVKAIFSGAQQITGECIYRVLGGVNRLMISTLGLKQVPSGRVSFRMFAGADVETGISEIIKSGSTKSNLFGYGFQEGNKISIGCSYKGKVWMRWIGKVNFWKEWCQNISRKVLDYTIDTSEIISNSLILEPIEEFPGGVPYKIVFPEEIEMTNSTVKNLFIPEEEQEYPFYQAELYNVELVDKKLRFELWINEKKYKFEQTISESEYEYEQLEGEPLLVKQRKNSTLMADYFREHAPEITFIQDDGTTVVVQGNLKVTVKPKKNINFSSESLLSLDWEKYDVDIKKESQGRDRKVDSIQYTTINELVDRNVTIIFDDDGTGEVADVVAINVDEMNRKISITFYHCKYSQKEKPGARLGDLYEVCGQSEKSIIWNDNIVGLIRRLIYRENYAQKKYNDTRIEKGDIEKLYAIEKMVKSGFETELSIAIVQPGVSISKLNDGMKQLILTTESYLKDTYGLSFTCYFSN